MRRSLNELVSFEDPVAPPTPKEEFEQILADAKERLDSVRGRIIGDSEEAEVLHILLDRTIDDISDNLTRLKRDL